MDFPGQSASREPFSLFNHSLSIYFDCFSVVIHYISYASITFALRREYDARTMSKSPQFPCGLRRETLRSSYGFTGIVGAQITG